MLLIAAEEGKLPTERGDQAKKLTEFQHEFLQRKHEEDEEDIPELHDESETEELVQDKRRQRTIYSKEMVNEISVYFDGFISGPKPRKPTQDDVIPFLDVLKEKGIKFSGSWIKIKEKVWSLARYAQKKATKKQEKSKGKGKKCSKARE